MLITLFKTFTLFTFTTPRLKYKLNINGLITLNIMIIVRSFCGIIVIKGYLIEDVKKGNDINVV